ncbi:MAG: insulinase family protein [Gemmatimonadetes bacterium]|nr:insulinase family protein [Gemmatimonadota bacterium]
MNARFAALGLAIAAVLLPPAELHAQARPFERLKYPPLEFNPPTPEERTLSNGIAVFLLEDHTLPLVNVIAVSKRGTAHFDPARYGAAEAVGVTMRTGGTEALTPDSLDRELEFLAAFLGTGTGDEASSASLNVLARHLGRGLELWADVIRQPRHDPSRIEVYRRQQMESWRRRNDTPGSIRARAFRKVMYGDHPLGRMLKPEHLEGLTPEVLRAVQAEIFCPENLLIGATGDFESGELVAELDRLLGDMPRCRGPLPELPPVEFPWGPAVIHLYKDVNQTNIQMGAPGGILVREDPDYFAAEVLDFVLGGSGFTSRMVKRVRSDAGYAYSVGTFWGADVDRQGIFGAAAETKVESTVAAIRLMQEVIRDILQNPPTPDELRTAKDFVVNSFVFRFEFPFQIVAQQLNYRIDGLPPDWFARYLRGIQGVARDDLIRVAQTYLKPDALTVIVVGDSARFDQPLHALGPVKTLSLEELDR